MNLYHQFSDILSTRFGTVISPFGLTRIEWNKYRNLPSIGSSWFKLFTVMDGSPD